MTKYQWLCLRPGDLIVETRSGVERKVIKVKRYDTGQTIRTWITLVKLHKSWTKSKFTHYTINDDQGRWRLKEQDEQSLRDPEHAQAEP